MILYDPALTASLLPYGILIPLRDSRASRTFAALNSDPGLAAWIAKRHCNTITESLARQDLLRVHDPEYVARLYGSGLEKEILAAFELIDSGGRYHRYAPDQARRPLCDLFQRIRAEASGTLQASRLALQNGFCFYFSGGMHHAHYDHGSGFCLINDIVIAARKLLAEKTVGHLWVIDVDAHKGDGTAALSAGDPAIITLSIHMAHGWPLDGPQHLADGSENPAFTPSDIDIGIGPGEEKHYLPRLREGLQRMAGMKKADLALVVSGADPFEGDELPSTAGLQLNLEQMLLRDRLIYSFLRDRGIPAAYLMAGGYGDRVWQVYAQFLVWALKKVQKAEVNRAE